MNIINILIKELPEFEVAFIRHVGSYFEPQEHWGKLVSWAINNGLFPPEQSYIGISLDNPDLVESNSCRHDACITIPKNFDKEKRNNDIHFKKMDGGHYAMYSFYDKPEKLNAAYKYIFEHWLSESEYCIDYTKNNLEFNMNNPAEDPEGKSKVNLFVPIEKREIADRNHD